MTPFTTLTSRTVVLPQENIDTDQILPARYLTTTSRDGLGKLAFRDWRYDPNGKLRGEMILNRIAPTAHRILVAGRNFGCGSSREHAPWALMDFGFRAVVSTEVADIFMSNALKNGFLPVVIDPATWGELSAHPGEMVAIDLELCELRFGDRIAKFKIESFARRCLLEGVDAMNWLLSHASAIEAYEKTCAT